MSKIVIPEALLSGVVKGWAKETLKKKWDPYWGDVIQGKR